MSQLNLFAFLIWMGLRSIPSVFFTSLFFTAMQAGFDCWLVTLVVAFSFLSQHFGRWRGPTNNSFAQNECILSGADNWRRWRHHNPTYCFKNSLFLFLGRKDTKTLISCARVEFQISYIFSPWHTMDFVPFVFVITSGLCSICSICA